MCIRDRSNTTRIVLADCSTVMCLETYSLKCPFSASSQRSIGYAEFQFARSFSRILFHLIDALDGQIIQTSQSWIGGVQRRGLNSKSAANILKLSLIHISEPTRLLSISYAVFC